MTSAPATVVSHPAPERGRVSTLRLLGALLLAPVAWLAQLLASYFFAANACQRGSEGLVPSSVPALWLVLLLINLACLTAGAMGMTLAWRAWRRTRDEKPGRGHHLLDVGEGRTRFAALSAAIVSGIFLFAIFAEFAALLILERCAPGNWL
jgi:hypothetical protein